MISSRSICVMSGSLDLGGGSVDVFVGDFVAKRAGKSNQALRCIRGHGLPALVVTDIALSAADSLPEFLLCQAKPLADGFDGAHVRTIAHLLIIVNSSTISLILQRR